LKREITWKIPFGDGNAGVRIVDILKQFDMKNNIGN